LKTKAAEPLIDSDFEYRVIEACAIENLYYNPITGREGKTPIPEMLYAYFGKEEVFRRQADVQEAIGTLEKDYAFLEYGVCMLDHSSIVFPSHLTDALVAAYEKQVDEKMSQVRKVEEAERDAKREASLILMFDAQKNVRAENGGTFIPNVAYGHLEKDGTKVYGSMSWDGEGRSYFLPSN
jgi:hypothetical protein